MNWVLHVHRTSRPCVMWIASSAVSVDADSLFIYLSSLDACPCGCARCGAPPQRVVMCSGGWLMLALGITQYTDRALSRGRSTVRAPWPVHGAVSGGHTYDVNRGVPSTVKNVRLSMSQTCACTPGARNRTRTSDVAGRPFRRSDYLRIIGCCVGKLCLDVEDL